MLQSGLRLCRQRTVVTATPTTTVFCQTTKRRSSIALQPLLFVRSMASEQKTPVLDREQFSALRLGAVKLKDGGKEVVHLAQANGTWAHVSQDPSQKGPTFDGTPDDFLQQHAAAHPALKVQLKNKIRKCTQCSKMVAFTLDQCNGCGSDMKGIAISQSNNIFTSFVHGIARGPFPFTISVRHQSDSLMVFDDLLSLTPCHLNIIPTSHYIPDWRWLLRDPARGLQLVEDLQAAAWRVAQTQFLASPEWRKSVLLDPTLSVEKLRECVVAGFNYPPSQYQLHLQFMLLPMTPVVYAQYLQGLHYTKDRFFPYEYVVRVLQLGAPFPVQEDTSVEEIIEFYQKKGVDYKAMHAATYAACQSIQERVSNWQPNDFSALINGEQVYAIPAESKETDQILLAAHKELTGKDVKSVANHDKLVLQNYGRPYNSDTSKPTGSYYAFAKKPGTLQSWL